MKRKTLFATTAFLLATLMIGCAMHFHFHYTPQMPADVLGVTIQEPDERNDE